MNQPFEGGEDDRGARTKGIAKNSGNARGKHKAAKLQGDPRRHESRRKGLATATQSPPKGSSRNPRAQNEPRTPLPRRVPAPPIPPKEDRRWSRIQSEPRPEMPAIPTGGNQIQSVRPQPTEQRRSRMISRSIPKLPPRMLRIV